MEPTSAPSEHHHKVLNKREIAAAVIAAILGTGVLMLIAYCAILQYRAYLDRKREAEVTVAMDKIFHKNHRQSMVVSNHYSDFDDLNNFREKKRNSATSIISETDEAAGNV